jgi:beta-1,4-mannosyl-glycoprotein beta-1,4-N-acetylglucosaminyltransferase
MSVNKIYDCFNFFNELDILEIRLNELYDIVDYFVIVESSITHSGENKPFYFEENKNRFSKFLDKIINFKIIDTPNDFINLTPTDDNELIKINEYIINQTNRFNRYSQPDYGRDFFQKESVRRALINCEDNDLILISDADEIPNQQILKNIKNLDLENTIYSLNQTMYCYYLNYLKQNDWYGTKMGLYKNIKKYSFNEIRGDVSLSTKINNGGWHFSFQGGLKMVTKKLLSYSARDMVNPYVLSSIEKNMENGIDPFFRGSLQKVIVDNSYPIYIQNNLVKLSHMIKNN